MILFIGILTVVVIGLVAGVEHTSNPRFCVSCHEMYPEYATWEQSAHSKISCDSCHIPPGLSSYVTSKFAGLDEIYKHYMGGYEIPIQLKKEISNETCLQCHSRNRSFTASGDLVMPHYEHLDKQMTCIKCHEGLVHGKIVKRGLVKSKQDFSQQAWTKEKVTQVMSEKNLKPGMDLCMSCHALRRVTLACNACHSTSKKPSSHKDKSFLTDHGHQAEKDLKDCDFCHGYGEAKKVVKQPIPGSNVKELADAKTIFGSSNKEVNQTDSLGLSNLKPRTTSVGQYAMENGFCFNCHAKKPPNHQSPDWRKLHGGKAKSDFNNCLTCHTNNPDGKNMMPAPTYCAKCHPSAHGRLSEINHPIDIEGKGFGEGCLTCHSAYACLSCHG